MSISSDETDQNFVGKVERIPMTEVLYRSRKIKVRKKHRNINFTQNIYGISLKKRKFNQTVRDGKLTSQIDNKYELHKRTYRPKTLNQRQTEQTKNEK